MHNSNKCICRLLCYLHRRVFYKLRHSFGSLNFITRKRRKIFVRSSKPWEIGFAIRYNSFKRLILWVLRRIEEHQQVDVIVSSRFFIPSDSCGFHLPSKINDGVVIPLIELKFRSVLLLIRFERIERGFSVRFNTPRPAHIIIFVSTIVKAGPCWLSRPNKQTPGVVRGEMLWILFLLLKFIAQCTIGRKIGRLSSLRLHSRNGDHCRNNRNCSKHRGQDGPSLPR